jgi:hypothetical protein
VFGRVAYNPKTSPRFWKEEFKARFGEEAGASLEKAIHLSSKVLPRIIGAVMIDFPTMAGFPEKKTGGSLGNYSKILPSDIQIFLSMEEAADLIIKGEQSAKVWPQQTSEWFAETSKEISKLVAQAENVIGGKRGKEFDSTIVDLKILAAIAEFHSNRLRAGVAYQIFNKSKNAAALNEAIVYETRAIVAYEKIVKAAGDVYADDLMFGRSQPPHWRDELAILKEDFNKLMQQRRDVKGKGGKAGKYEMTFGQGPVLSHTPIKTADAGKKLKITATVSDLDGVKWVRLLYRSVTQFQDYKVLEMKPTDRPNQFAATVPAEDVDPAWDFMYLFEVMDKAGNGKIYPDFEKETPYIVVRLKR